MSFNEIIILTSIGIVGGLLSGSLGVAAGIVIIPSLVYFLGLNQHQAQGTFLSIFVLPVMIFSAHQYYKSGNVNIKYTAILMVAFIIGSFLGAKFSQHIPSKILNKGFAVFLLIVALKMLFTK